jgi:hypothetical protein
MAKFSILVSSYTFNSYFRLFPQIAEYSGKCPVGNFALENCNFESIWMMILIYVPLWAQGFEEENLTGGEASCGSRNNTWRFKRRFNYFRRESLRNISGGALLNKAALIKQFLIYANDASGWTSEGSISSYY